MRIGLFAPCLGDTMYPEAVAATAQVLQALGHDVVFPESQTCCGQMHLNSGYPEEARRLAKRFVRNFDVFEAVVAPSSSCVGTVRDLYAQMLQVTDPVTERVFELSEFIVNRLHVDEVGARFPARVTYHPTCHSLRVLQVGDAPTRLLKRVRELELVELPLAEECCGFGGTFSVKNAETSSAILADKCACITETHADYCTALDVSCLMQITGGLSRRQSRTKTIHLAEILATR